VISDLGLAEVVLDTWWMLFCNLVSRQRLSTAKRGSVCDSDFAVIGYGKLGGIELGYSSDLDLVFVYKRGLNKARWRQA